MDEQTESSSLYESPAEMPTDEHNVPEQDLSELDKYWKAVKDNPSDFTGWTYLLQYVEQENLLDGARKAYDAFFERYPYCYGYWKKYADMEKHHNCIDRVQQVFERGIEAIALSIDLWLHYLWFMIAQSRKGLDSDADSKVEALFERAIAAAGLEFRSDRLWEAYINWLKEKGTSQKVVAVFDRLLKIPTQHYKQHFESFCELVPRYHPRDLLSHDEFSSLCKQVVGKATSPLATIVETTPDDDDTAAAAYEEAANDEMPPGIDDILPAANGQESNLLELNEQETTLLIQKVIEIRRSWHQATEEEAVKRWNFEELIRRPYFHVKPLERSQLKNWKDYLDFEIANGSYERIIILFERCLIACTLYGEYWLKYAKCVESRDVEKARSVLRRACHIHLPQKPSVHMAWAAFEERHGCHDAALEVIAALEQAVPGLAVVALRRIAVERHRGNHAAVDDLYRKYITQADSTELRNFYSSKYARYQSKVCGNIDKAKEILEEALQKDSANSKLYLQLIDLEYQRASLNEENIVVIFDRAINGAGLTVEQRFIFSQRKLEFLEDFGSNIDSIEQAYDEHQKLSKDMQVIKKHRLSSTDFSFYDETPRFSKRTKTENSTSSSSHHYTNGDYASSAMPPPAAAPILPPHPMAPSSSGGYDAAAAGSMMPPYNGYGYAPAPPAWPGYAAAPMYDYRSNPWSYPQQYYPQQPPPML